MPRRWTIDDMQSLAAEHGGRCISKRFAGTDTKLTWQCAQGHRWKTIPYLIINGSWCPTCRLGRKPRAEVLQDMRACAKKRGGRCLARSYGKAKDDYEWECAKGHRWHRSWDEIRSGKWCPRCVGRLPPDEALAVLREIVEARGGELLSPKYVNAKTKVKVRCAKGHRWSPTPSDLKTGKWCAKCARNAPLTLEQMRRVAKKRGGELVSTALRAGRKVRWRCAEGHEWLAMPSTVKSGTWCPTCAKAPRYTLADMQKLARSRGGECISKRFVTMNHHLEWRCAHGHTWRAKGTQLLRVETWCPHCARVAKLTIGDIRRSAEERGGKCLTRRYVNVLTKMRFRCADDHDFEMTATSLRKGAWCPYCARRGKKGIEDFLYSELVEYAESRGGGVVSDAYVDAATPMRFRCQVGHEWNAAPGSVVEGTWCPKCAHTRKPRLETFQKLARERGGRCLSKTYVNSTTRLAFRCRRGHYWETLPATIRNGSWCPVCARSNPMRESLSLEDFQQIARENGGECLSDDYVRLRDPLSWRCKLGHEWEAAARSVRAGSWCPVCSGRVPLTLEDMQANAANRGGRCVSKKYRGVRTKLKWECAEGHRWWATPQTIRNGSWCPKCLDPRVDIGIARVCELARKHGGLCLSASYYDPSKRLRWRCAEGHTWLATEATVLEGHWCPRC